jgi:hypothetical protein
VTTNQWRTLFGVIAAVCSFMLIQTDVALDPLVKLVIGAVSVGVAVIQAPQNPE